MSGPQLHTWELREAQRPSWIRAVPERLRVRAAGGAGGSCLWVHIIRKLSGELPYSTQLTDLTKGLSSLNIGLILDQKDCVHTSAPSLPS